jgi:hypothetical protein
VALWPFSHPADPTALDGPLKFLPHHLGFVACLLLATVLAFSPLRVLFPKSAIALALNPPPPARRRERLSPTALLHFVVQPLAIDSGRQST